MKRVIIWIMLVCGMVQGSFAQNYQIKGIVKDSRNSDYMEFANVVLQTPDSVFIQGTTTDMQGKFTLSQITSGDYLIAVSSLGYNNHVISVNGLNSHMDLDEILIDQSAISLESVTVQGSNMTSRQDKKIIFPSDRQVKASSNGINLLQQLMLPKLQVNPLYNTVSLPGGGEVQLRINGVKVEESEIVALNPEDIIRVEFHDNPGLRYGNAEVVLDYIVRRPETGGNINLDLAQGLNTIWGRDQISAKINHKSSEFSLNYSYNPRNFKEVWRDNEEVFTFEDGSSLHRMEIGEPGKMKMNWQNLNINYSLQHPEKYLFNATFRMNHNQHRLDYSGIMYNVRRPEDQVEMIDKSRERSNRPAIDLYYQHNLNNDQTIVFNVVGTYNTSYYKRIYSESRDQSVLTDVNNRVDGDKYSIIGEGIYEKKMGDNRISGGLKYTHSISDNQYMNGTIYDTHMKQSEGYAFTEFRGKANKLDYTLGMGVSRYWFHQRGEEKSYHYYNYHPRISIQYNLPSQSLVRLNARMSNSSPSLSDLSDVSQTVDSLQIQRGNPHLKPYMRYSVSLTYEIQKKFFYGSLFGEYEYFPKAIMEEKFQEGNKIIQTWDNQKKWEKYTGRLYTRFGPFKDIFQFSFTGGVNHYLSNGNHYFHRYTNWWYNVSATATYKNWVVMAEVFNGWNWFWGESLQGGENLHLLGVKYNKNNWSVGLGVFNPFVDNYKVKQENWSAQASSIRAMYVNESSRMFMLNLAYNFSFGRTVQSAQKRLNNSDNDSGVMSTGK